MYYNTRTDFATERGSERYREQDEEDLYSKDTSVIPEGFIHTASELQAVFSTSNPVRVRTAT